MHDMSIGQKIRERRMELGWTQRDLAAKMEYSNNSTIARIEAGNVDVPQSRIVQFSKVLGVTVAHLMGWEEAIEAQPVEMAGLHAEMLMDADLNELFEDFKLLSAAEKQIIKDLARSLAQTKKAEA